MREHGSSARLRRRCTWPDASGARSSSRQPPTTRSSAGTTERRLVSFAQVVSLALASADAREQLHASRKRLVQVADDERRRLERDLHDGAQQRLVAVSQRLHLARRFLETGGDATREQLEICSSEVREALEDLRRLANGLHPPILTEAGLRPALWALARRSALPVTLGTFPDERFPADLETATYYLVSEALTNTAKHARASTADVRVRRTTAASSSRSPTTASAAPTPGRAAASAA